MKRNLIYAGMMAALALPLISKGQVVQNPPKSPHTLNHGEVGVYGDYFRLSPARNTNLLGLGGRVGFNVHPNIALEAEMNYDFEKNYTTVNTNGTSAGGTTTTVTSGIRPITGLFGPKFQVGTSGPFRAFVTGKVGFVDFATSGGSPSGSTFTNSFNNFGSGGTYFAAYPGGGVEAFIGPIGIRAEAGDELYVNNGVQNNLRVTFGPTIRF